MTFESCRTEMSVDYVDLLSSEQRNPNALLLQLLESEYVQWDYIIAVEGPDDRVFYYDFIQSYLDKPHAPFIDCGGKDSLLAFKRAVDEYRWHVRPSFLFLCDKDFDDYLGRYSEEVFYVEYYSIESFFISRSYVEYIVGKYSNAAISQAEKLAFVDLVNSRFIAMISVARMLCALMCEIRARNLHPDFDLIDLSFMFELNRAEPIRRAGLLRRAKERLQLNVDIPILDILRRSSNFPLVDFQRWLRGKLGLQILRKCYDIAWRDVDSNLHGRLPKSNHFSRDVFGVAKAFTPEIPLLQAYCLARRRV